MMISLGTREERLSKKGKGREGKGELSLLLKNSEDSLNTVFQFWHLRNRIISLFCVRFLCRSGFQKIKDRREDPRVQAPVRGLGTAGAAS
jgi:hypothetical protein